MNILGAGGNGFNLGGSGPSDAIAFPNLYQLFGSEGNATAARIQSSIASWAASQASPGLSAKALQQIFQVQANLIIHNNGVCPYVRERLSSLYSYYFSLAPVAEFYSDTGYPE